jgi:NAD(P)-dependent dehydrogenase (short-subunit alcohol dehydrogenase family)
VSSPAFDLTGKGAVVAGGGGGLGRGVALALAAAGAVVVVIGRDRLRLEDTCAAVASVGGLAMPYVADVTLPDAFELALDAAAARAGSIDVLANCAGIQLRKPALDVTPDEWDVMIDTNLKAVFFSCQAAARRMGGRGGSIINVTSLTEFIGIPTLSVYGACKGGVAQMTRAMAVEWAASSIRVNAVAPGRIRTAMTEQLFEDHETRESFQRLIPIARLGLASDIGNAAVFLASQASSYVTGQTLVVDGGWMAAGGAPKR